MLTIAGGIVLAVLALLFFPLILVLLRGALVGAVFVTIIAILILASVLT